MAEKSTFQNDQFEHDQLHYRECESLATPRTAFGRARLAPACRARLDFEY